MYVLIISIRIYYRIPTLAQLFSNENKNSEGLHRHIMYAMIFTWSLTASKIWSPIQCHLQSRRQHMDFLPCRPIGSSISLARCPVASSQPRARYWLGLHCSLRIPTLGQRRHFPPLDQAKNCKTKNGQEKSFIKKAQQTSWNQRTW